VKQSAKWLGRKS